MRVSFRVKQSTPDLCSWCFYRWRDFQISPVNPAAVILFTAKRPSGSLKLYLCLAGPAALVVLTRNYLATEPRWGTKPSARGQKRHEWQWLHWLSRCWRTGNLRSRLSGWYSESAESRHRNWKKRKRWNGFAPSFKVATPYHPMQTGVQVCGWNLSHGSANLSSFRNCGLIGGWQEERNIVVDIWRQKRRKVKRWGKWSIKDQKFTFKRESS